MSADQFQSRNTLQMVFVALSDKRIVSDSVKIVSTHALQMIGVDVHGTAFIRANMDEHYGDYWQLVASLAGNCIGSLYC